VNNKLLVHFEGRPSI